MTAAALTARIDRPSFVSRLAVGWKLLREGMAEGRRLAASYDRLTRLPDSELARIGLAREEIPQAVAHGY